MTRMIAVVLVLALAGPAFALDEVFTRPQVSPCKKVDTNTSGVARAAITITTIPSGVQVLVASTTRCRALIKNSGTTNTMNCTPASDGAPTATAGWPVVPGEVLVLGLEGQEQWSCIAIGSSTTATTAEAVP